MRVLVFDTETTGLPPKNTPVNHVDKWPHIIQLSWAIYNDETKQVDDEQDYIISIGTNIPISAESIAVHGITSEYSRAKGVAIEVALFDFKRASDRCGMIVAHNLEFDMNMLKVEAHRNRMWHFRFPTIEYCTMKEGTKMCQIKKMWDDGTVSLKYPKLVELYRYLFGDDAPEPQGLHNAKIDVDVCLKCYIKMKDLTNDDKLRLQ